MSQTTNLLFQDKSFVERMEELKNESPEEEDLRNIEEELRSIEEANNLIQIDQDKIKEDSLNYGN